VGSGFIWIRLGTSGRKGGSCEHGNEPLGSIKGGEFLDWLSDYYLLKKDSVPWT
jgi:hypothetical protein